MATRRNTWRLAYHRSALEELIRWRLWNRTGGGLMAELGSHQLDASGIFISGLREGRRKGLAAYRQPRSAAAFFPLDRDCEDHVYCIYEFPGPEYEADPNKKIGVTYSSINGNGFGGYGETVMGTKGTLILEREARSHAVQGCRYGNQCLGRQRQEGGPHARHDS